MTFVQFLTMFIKIEHKILLNTESDIMNAQDKTVVEKALDAFRKKTRVQTQFLCEKILADQFSDGVIQFSHEGLEWKFKAEIRLRLNRATIALLKHQMNDTEKVLVVTDYVNPQLAEVMRDHGIPFIDAAGNAFINAPPLYIFVKGDKPDKAMKAEPVKRLFKPSGLKLIFALLNNPGMEKATYRDIAKAANVALGTVDMAVTELGDLGFLIDMGKKGRQLLKTEQLLKRWVEAYPEQLRPKLVQERFRTDNRNWWKVIKPTEFEVLWSGEIAAAELTGYLKPEKFIIYTNRPLGNLIFKCKLQKDPNGNVELLLPFWTFTWDLAEKGLVPPLLVYADLVATGDVRNIEAAKMIYDKYLAELVRKDR